MVKILRGLKPAIATCLTALTVLVTNAHARSSFDPLVLYGAEARYDIFRNGENVGHHTVSFSRNGETVVATSRSEIEVPFLFLTAYRLDYEAVSSWRDGRLLSLRASTDDDGDRYEVTAEPADGVMRVSGTEGTINGPAGLLPTEHWSRNVIDRNILLNTITGTLDEVVVTALGTAFVPAASGVVEAERFHIHGGLEFETWYARSGRWLGMRFPAKDGSMIEYRCRDCGSQLATAE